jgi:hypothetical protein
MKKSKNERVTSESNDNRFLLYRKRNHDLRVLEDQKVNRKYYLEVLTKLREGVRKKTQELWKKKSWILQQDNAPAHNALAVKQFVADKCIPMPEPDLAPLTFTCSPK